MCVRGIYFCFVLTLVSPEIRNPVARDVAVLHAPPHCVYADEMEKNDFREQPRSDFLVALRFLQSLFFIALSIFRQKSPREDQSEGARHFATVDGVTTAMLPVLSNLQHEVVQHRGRSRDNPTFY